jgi:hypothetical protein
MSAPKNQEKRAEWIKKLQEANLGISRPMSEEARKKISVARKLRMKRIGYLNDVGTRKKISERLKGKHSSPETEFKPGEHCGEKNNNWKGGLQNDGQGYIRVVAPNHPFAVYGKIRQHRLVVEKNIGRILKKTEVVHHINAIRDDNRIENLYLFESDYKHKKFHAKPFNLISNIKKC